MNLKHILFITALAALFLTCKKEREDTVCGYRDSRAKNYSPSANCADSSCIYESSVVFWSKNMNTGEIIIVEMAGKKDTITVRYDGGYLKPTCVGNYLAKFSVPPGDYTYKAETGSRPPLPVRKWNGSIKLDTMGRYECVFVNLE